MEELEHSSNADLSPEAMRFLRWQHKEKVYQAIFAVDKEELDRMHEHTESGMNLGVFPLGYNNLR